MAFARVSTNLSATTTEQGEYALTSQRDAIFRVGQNNEKAGHTRLFHSILNKDCNQKL